MEELTHKKCIVCGKLFKVKPSHFNKRFCCSRECMAISFKTKMKGINNPNYKKAGNRICLYCGMEYKSYDSTRKYCSHKCSSMARIGVPRDVRSMQKGRDLYNKKRAKITAIKKTCVCGNIKEAGAKLCRVCYNKKHKKEYEIRNANICEYCGKEFVSRSLGIKGNTKFCSRECFSESRKLKYKGNNNPNWRGGVKSINQIGRYAVDYVHWRNSIFERDKYTCQLCGQIGGELHAHHIVRWSKNIESRLDINNGMTLCIKCHKNIHRKTA